MVGSHEQRLPDPLVDLEPAVGPDQRLDHPRLRVDRQRRLVDLNGGAGGRCATVCYMVADQPERVGVRELRQNLSVYLRRVGEGETLEVTEHGRPVARLTPLPRGTATLDQLIAEGRATPATMRIEDLPPLTGPITNETGRILEELREERL